MSITAIILTFNEEIHIERCIQSLQRVCSRICIVDSFSSDRTVEIARSLGAEVFQNKWENNYSKQLNWGIENCNITTPWIMRMDADEYLMNELQEEIEKKMSGIPEGVSGIELTRRVLFKGQWIKHGSYYPIRLLRIWRTGRGYCEKRLMDEHIIVDGGEVLRFDHDLVDENLNSLHWWVTKHNNYARREAADALNLKYNLISSTDIREHSAGNQAKVKRFLKNRMYNKMPLGLRPVLYFLFRMTIQLGILDGKKGLVFHFNQGLWYRLLIDVLIWEVENEVGGDKEKVRDIIENRWKVSLV